MHPPVRAQARVPDNLPLDVAAGVPLASLTGWQALQQAAPAPGKRALVTAASGGVGHLTVQVCAHTCTGHLGANKAHFSILRSHLDRHTHTHTHA